MLFQSPLSSVLQAFEIPEPPHRLLPAPPYVNVRGVSIFHAGDLNDWKMEHVGELINGKQERTFRHEIRKLADKPVNFAFVPMDPRLGPYQTLGIDFVLKNTDAEFVFPMHMWQDYSAIREYKKHITNLGMADHISANT